MKKLILVLVIVGLLAPVSFGIAAEKEQYSATVVGTQGPLSARSIGVNIYIDEYTTDQEVMELYELLVEGGQDMLRRKLEKIEKGRIAPTFSVGNDIAIARVFQKEEGRLIRIVTARTMPFLEMYIGGRSTDYPFGLMEFTIGKDGKGQGVVIGAAKVKLSKDGTISIESYGHEPLKVVNVKLEE